MAADLLTVIVASGSCVAFCLLVLMLLVVLHRRDRFCCRLTWYTEERRTDDPPHYHSRHTLMVPDQDQSRTAQNQADVGSQLPGRMFIIGKPNHYHMEGILPRLPSYESVRRKDRQRQIHSMIAQRFGLDGFHDEAPPSYEESLRDSLQSVDVPVSSHSQNQPSNLT